MFIHIIIRIILVLVQTRIVFSEYDINEIKDNKRIRKSILINPVKNWSATIEYVIAYNLNSLVIKSVLLRLSKSTCLQFKQFEYQNPSRYQIQFSRSNQCASTVGAPIKRKNAIIALTIECSDNYGMVVHEVGHALGVIHQHQRHDREKYIKVSDKTVPKRLESDVILKADNISFGFYNITYDYGSIMHYPPKTEDAEPANILTAKNINPYNDMLGQRQDFSFNDIKLINKYYCSISCTDSDVKCKNGGYHTSNSTCEKCVCPKNYIGSDCGNIKIMSSKHCNETEKIANETSIKLSEKGKKSCHFLIKSTNQKRLLIDLLHVRTLKRLICSTGLGVEIKYLNDKGKTGLCLCGEYDNVEIISEGPEVYIEYNGYRNENYFYMQYQEYLNKSDTGSKICYQSQCFDET